MPVLSFKVQADIQKVRDLRNEIVQLEAAMKQMKGKMPTADVSMLESRLASAKTELVSVTTEAAKAGASFGSELKKKINETSNAVNGFTEKIIEQRGVIKGIEADVKKLGDAYAKAVKNGSPEANAILGDYKAAKKALEEEKTTLFGLNQEKTKAQLQTKKLNEEYAQYKEQAQGAAKQTENLSDVMANWAKGIIGVKALQSFVSEVVRVRGEFQDMENAITTLVGDKTASKLLPQIKELAKVSPLAMTDIVGAEKTMLGFNIEADKTIRYLQAMSDISMGNSQKFQSLTLAFSQMSASGKLMGQDLMQMINVGFNPLQVISEKTGKSIAQLKKEMSAGAISAEMVQQAFIDATSAGGKFYNMSQNASKTINGQISMLQDAMDNMFNSIGTASEGIIIKIIQGATSLVENWETLGGILISLISTYGVYRAALLANIALEKVAAAQRLASVKGISTMRLAYNALTASVMKLNAAMLANPFVIAAAAVVGVAIGMYKLLNANTGVETGLAKVNNEIERLRENQKKLSEDVSSYISIIQSETSTELQKADAYKKLSLLFPQLTGKYKQAELAAMGQANATKALNKELENQEILLTKKQIREAQNRIKVLKAEQDVFKRTGNKAAVSNRAAQILEEEKALEQLNEKLQEFRSANKQAQQQEQIKNKEYWEKRKKEAQSKLEALDVSKKGSEEWKKYEKEIADAQKEIDKYSTTKTAKDTKDANQEKAKRAENLKRIQEYKDEVIDAKKQAEFEIRQAEINAMKDGSDKTLAQINLDYDKKIEANKKREKDFIKTIADQKALEWEVANPDKAKRGEKFDKSTITVADLTPQQRQILEFYDQIAKKEKETAEANTYKGILEKYQTYMQKRKDVYRKYNEDLAAMKDEQGNYREGFSAENEAILNKEMQDALAAIDVEFAMKEEAFQTWANKVGQYSLEALTRLLNDAEVAVEAAKAKAAKGEISQEELGKYLAALEVIKKAKKEAALTPEQKAEKDWKDLYKVLNDISGQFEKIGAEVGGTAGEIIALAGTISTGILSMIDGIKAISKSATVELKAVEKASVILGIISTAIQLLQKVNSLTSNIAFKEYERYASKVKEINDLTDAVNQYKEAVLEAAIAENNWFSTDNLKQLRDYKKLQEEVFNSYMAKLMEAQAVYQNQSGGGWLTDPLNWVMGNMSILSWWDEWRDIWGQGGYDEGITAAINNLRIETRKASKGIFGSGIGGKSQKTEDLVEWVRKQGLGELFNEEGMINKELAESILENYGDKLVGQTKETLEALLQLKEQYDEYIEQLREYVSSLYEPLVDNFVDSLWAWFDEGKDALDSFKNYASDTFRDIVSDMMKTIVLEKVVGSFSDDIADLYEEYSKGKIDEATLMKKIADRTGSLVDTYEEQVPVLQNIMNLLNSTLEEAGISLKQDQKTEQQSTYGGFETMSEQTGSELNGRFTALQMAGEEIKRDATFQSITLSDIKGSLENYFPMMEGVKTSIDNILTFISQSYMELQQINENTSANVKELKSVSSYIKKWDTKIMGL